MTTEPDNRPPQIIIYETDDKVAKLSVRLEDETVWLTNLQLAELFQVSKSTVSEHIKNIFESAELSPDAVVRNFRTTAADGKTYGMSFYSLDMIISLGYRINSKVATQFRQWATARLREYIVKGFAMDDDRLKELGGGGYWKELLERIRDIRASEKVFYRQVLDIYATSVDYDPDADESVAFFRKVQNKIHFAVHGQTAAEVIHSRADAEKEFMGLLSFTGSRPHLADAVIAKNYLTVPELRALGQIVAGYLDFAERQAERQVPMTMRDWATHLDTILTATGERLLVDAGGVSHEQAVKKARTEYVKYQVRTLSDVEKQYLASIKDAESAVKKRKRK
ncbi:MAG: virulence RhuM family protein [Lentisphaerae bacterium]|nr:virulence RhuM family protein [Lentisphaerota bacterium]